MKFLKLMPISCVLLVSMIINSCGKSPNIYSSVYKEDDKQRAADAINSGNYNYAIALLTPYVSQNPTDYSAQSMLANAYMQLAGIDLLKIAVALSTSVNTSKNNLYAVIQAFPIGTSGNISSINTALGLLNGIPSSALTSNQVYQKAIANAGLAFLTITKNILDSTGSISTTLVSSMSETDSNTIYNALVRVQANLNSLGVIAGTGSGSGVLLNIINQITSTSGSSPAVQLATFFLSNA